MLTQKTRLESRTKRNASGEVRRVGFYIRVSTEEQAENPEGSIKNQEERLKMALSLRNGDSPFGKCVAVFCDTKSGKDMNRPEFQKLLKAIERGEINMVMVSEVSRLSRSIKDFSQIWEFMQAHGCGFLSLRENFDTSTAAGEMMLFSIANFAQFERRQTSERVTAGFLSRAQRGLWNGGVLPIGYEPDPANKGSLRIIENEAQTVRTAFEVLLREGSVFEAAKWLNNNGYSYSAPIRGAGRKPRTKHFTFEALYRLVSNPAYAGRRVVRSKKKELETVAAVWPAIIDQDTFDRAQKVIEAGKKQKTGRETRYPYLLSTRIFCEECGAPLIGNSAHGSTTKVPYYGHGSQTRRESTLKEKGHRCSPFRVPGRKIEERVWNEVLQLMENPSHREPLFNAIQALALSQPRKQETEKKLSDLLATNDKLANLAKRIADLPQGIPADALYDEMRRLTDHQSALKTQLDAVKREGEEQRLAGRAEYDRLLKKLRDQLHSITPESKRRIIHALVQKVVINKSGFALHFYAGMEQIKKGEALASPFSSSGLNNSVQSSFKHLHGGQCRGGQELAPASRRRSSRPWDFAFRAHHGRSPSAGGRRIPFDPFFSPTK